MIHCFKYAFQVLSRYLEEYIEKIQKVQIRDTYIHNGFNEFSNEDRLRRVGLKTIKDRRIKGMLKCYINIKI